MSYQMDALEEEVKEGLLEHLDYTDYEVFLSKFDGDLSADPPETSPPIIISVSPSDDVACVPVTTTISATFSKAMNHASVEAAFSVTLHINSVPVFVKV